jgi:uncharacterized membrane protein HdeD (DUF308 family)
MITVAPEEGLAVIQTLSKNWWLLVVCGVLYAVMSAINFGHVANGFHAARDVVFMARVALAAGACAIVAGVWGSKKDSSWFLALNGLALVALGLLLLRAGAGARVGVRSIMFLMILMAISLGIVELAASRTMRRLHQFADRWVLATAGVISLAFVLPFVALGFGWVRIEPPSNPELLWFGLYFAFSAVCMLGLALRLHSRGLQGALS